MVSQPLHGITDDTYHCRDKIKQRIKLQIIGCILQYFGIFASSYHVNQPVSDCITCNNGKAAPDTGI